MAMYSHADIAMQIHKTYNQTSINSVQILLDTNDHFDRCVQSSLPFNWFLCN